MGAYADQVLALTPVNFYQMDSVEPSSDILDDGSYAFDEVFSRAAGVDMDAASLITWGDSGTSAELTSGSDQSASATNAADALASYFGIGAASTDYTLEAWLKVGSGFTGDTTTGTKWYIGRPVWEIREHGADPQVPFCFGMDAGKLALGFCAGVEANAEVHTSSQLINDGNVYHCVARVSSAGVDLFVNNSKTNSATSLYASDKSISSGETCTWRMGNRSSNTGLAAATPWRGFLDGIALYDYALTDEEISLNYSNTVSSGGILLPHLRRRRRV